MKYTLIRRLEEQDAYKEINRMYERGFVAARDAVLEYPPVQTGPDVYHRVVKYLCEVQIEEHKLCYLANGAEYVIDLYLIER